MNGNLKLLINFIWKFMGTVHFGNDHIAVILGYGYLQWGNILSTRVYFAEGLGYNLFSVRQFCDSDLEVAFRRNTCFVRNLIGVDLLKGNHTKNLYTIKLYEMAFASPICLIALATSTKSWLWHQRKKQNNTSQTQIRSKFKVEVTPSSYGFVWPDETRKYQQDAICSGDSGCLLSLSHYVRNDNVTEFKNQLLEEYFDDVSISRQTSSIKTPQQNRVVERRNQTLTEAIATVCYTHNRSLIHQRFDKTPYELINGRKPDISFLHVLGTLCYPKNDCEDIRKLGAKGDIGCFIGYSAISCAYKVYNRRTRKITETMNLRFDELSAMTFEQCSSKPELQGMISGHISSGLDLTYAPSTITSQKPTER
ncbi:retrovirus-related pol polyprotein from transposon TNT 1-94 [Tanacetum coccineum]|uniref:Retrovirus-related pol polyprotein from transposon TNT 1-94 n=1 Tax=Tanacetum coccineum TaxID=301880 RepID=A0ABQ4WUT5_9ASTR